MRSESEMMFAICGLVVLLLMALISLALFYMAYFRMGEILRHLSRSPAVIFREKSLGLDPFSRFFMISLIGTLLIFSRASLRRGDLDLQDYQLFPIKLKRLISCLCGLMLALALIVIGFGVVGKYIGWLK